LWQPDGLEKGRIRAHIPGMAEGWNIVTRRSDPNGGPDLHGRFVVRVADKETAVSLVESKMPDAMVLIDSEASAETLDTYLVKPGELFVLVEGK
jgi:hypothetical protein